MEPSSAQRTSYWFPARRSGFGWGVPYDWRGMLVLLLFTVLAIAGAYVFPPKVAELAYALYIAVLIALLLLVLRLKGEPPH